MASFRRFAKAAPYIFEDTDSELRWGLKLIGEILLRNPKHEVGGWEMRTELQEALSLSSEVRRYTSKLSEMSETRTLATEFERLINQFGFRYYVISGIPDSTSHLEDLIVLHNLPEMWVSEYIAKDYIASDPIVRRCRSSHDPFYWQEISSADSADARRVMQRATFFGLVNGVCFPIHNINGFEAGVSISGSENVLPSHEMRYLHLAAIMTFNSLRNLRSDHSLRVESISAREIEILTWCMLGKTSKEIAYILFISENTVNVHIKHAIRKLSAKNKTDAVAIAARKGLISF